MASEAAAASGGGGGGSGGSGAIDRVSRVAITGGTHGNEYAGVFTLKRLQKHPEIVARDSFEEVRMILSNPKAFADNRRFIDTDLNRAFTMEALADITAPGYEMSRAKALNVVLGPKGSPSPAFDFVLDFHTTTTNMGITLIVVGTEALPMRAAVYAHNKLEEEGERAFVLWERFEPKDAPYVCSAGRHGMMIEIGPIPQGVLRHDVVRQMERATELIMDYLHMHNTGTAPALPAKALVYEDQRVKIPCPVDADGKPAAVFHEKFQDRDFLPLRKGDPMFVTLDGETIAYDGSIGDEIIPVFINEGAYYYAQSGLGFNVTKAIEIDMP